MNFLLQQSFTFNGVKISQDNITSGFEDHFAYLVIWFNKYFKNVNNNNLYGFDIHLTLLLNSFLSKNMETHGVYLRQYFESKIWQYEIDKIFNFNKRKKMNILFAVKAQRYLYYNYKLK